jgi:L-rhamnose isomerase
MNNEPYHISKEIYTSWGVDCEAALKRRESIPISLHCWQGDDVGGFEHGGATLSGGGIQTTGNYPGKARSLEELRQDLDRALSLIPGKHRLKPPRSLRGLQRNEGSASQRAFPRAFSKLDRLVPRPGAGPRFQSQLLLPPAGG